RDQRRHRRANRYRHRRGVQRHRDQAARRPVRLSHPPVRDPRPGQRAAARMPGAAGAADQLRRHRFGRPADLFGDFRPEARCRPDHPVGLRHGRPRQRRRDAGGGPDHGRRLRPRRPGPRLCRRRRADDHRQSLAGAGRFQRDPAIDHWPVHRAGRDTDRGRDTRRGGTVDGRGADLAPLLLGRLRGYRRWRRAGAAPAPADGVGRLGQERAAARPGRPGAVTMDPWAGRLFNGGWVAPRGGRIEVLEPATGERLAEVGRADEQDVRAACARAAEAQPDWAASAPRERAAILRRAASFFETNADRIGQWIVRETGAVRGKAAVERRIATDELHQAAAMVLEPPGLILPSEDGVTSLARRVPRGVIGVISPFNFPLLLSARALAPALAVGNAVVLKPDPRTPVTGGLLLARGCEEAGLPEGVLPVLPGEAQAGDAVVGDPDTAMISFTGSTDAGRRVATRAAASLKPVSLELGGKNAL